MHRDGEIGSKLVLLLAGVGAIMWGGSRLANPCFGHVGAAGAEASTRGGAVAFHEEVDVTSKSYRVHTLSK